MEPTKVIVEELPKVSWYREWIPIFIAILALVISLISINLTRKDFIRNTRPFAWAKKRWMLFLELFWIICKLLAVLPIYLIFLGS